MDEVDDANGSIACATSFLSLLPFMGWSCKPDYPYILVGARILEILSRIPFGQFGLGSSPAPKLPHHRILDSEARSPSSILQQLERPQDHSGFKVLLGGFYVTIVGIYIKQKGFRHVVT